MASFRIATASGRSVDLSKSKFTPFRSIDTGTGQPSGPMVWPACEPGHLSSQSLTPSPSLSMSAQVGAAGAGATGAVGSGPSGMTTPTEARSRRTSLPAEQPTLVVVEVGAIGEFGADRDAMRERALDTHADLGGEVAVLALARGVRVREVVELFFRTLVAQAHQHVRDSSRGLPG